RAPHPAQLPGPAARAGELHLRLRHPGRGHPRLPRRGRAALRALLGQRDRQRQERHPRGVLGEPLSRARPDPGRAEPEPARRRIARHPGSAPSRSLTRRKPMTSSDLCWTPATELARLIRSRALSPVEVMQAVLDRIDRVNPLLNAFCTPTVEAALEG